MSIIKYNVLFFLAFFQVGQVLAAAPQVILPAACTPGIDCWVVNHVDMNPQTGTAQDFTCGPRTYDIHEGTDFGLRDRKAIDAGVSVLAAAPGTVLRVRAAMPDGQPSPEEIEKLLGENKGCGNGVLVEHGDGWQSIYCHLKSGSITVKPGDKVAAGQKIADVGQSGAAEFPHVHFGLFHNNRTVDPYTGTYAEDGCGKIKEPMWLYGIKVDYEPFAIFASGFDAAVPDFNRIKQDSSSPVKMAPQQDVLTFWAGLYGMQARDKVVLRIIAPDGAVFAENAMDQKNDKSRQFYYVGKRISAPLAEGTYTGTVSITRAIAGTEETFSRTAERRLDIAVPVTGTPQDGAGGMLVP